MELTQLILTVFITALFCNGWNIVSSKGNLLHLIRKPFDKAMDNIDYLEQKIALLSQFKNNKYHIDYLSKKLLFNKILYYIGKPFVLCITCYSSIWGFSVFVALNGLHIDTIPHLIINSVSAAYLNTLIYKHYVKLD